MIDFTDMPKRKKAYSGANGGKMAVVFDGERYMLKFPAPPKIDTEKSCTNGCITEYICSHIFGIVGIPAQETILGTYRLNGQEKIVVACRDFTTCETTLQDFASLKNTMVEAGYNGYNTELSELLEAIDKQDFINTEELKKHFWDMFIVDAFVGNRARHNGNWGFLYNNRTDSISIAPIYDCGSCLYPQADAALMEKTLTDPAEMNHRIFESPASCIRLNGEKICYFDFISSLQNRDCNAALKRIVPHIDMKRIETLIKETPYISALQKRFYFTMLLERKERILDKSLSLLQRHERREK